MLFIKASFRLAIVTGMRWVARAVSSVWKRMLSMGMSVANEKMFSTAERMLNSTLSARYFL